MNDVNTPERRHSGKAVALVLFASIFVAPVVAVIAIAAVALS